MRPTRIGNGWDKPPQKKNLWELYRLAENEGRSTDLSHTDRRTDGCGDHTIFSTSATTDRYKSEGALLTCARKWLSQDFCFFSIRNNLRLHLGETVEYESTVMGSINRFIHCFSRSFSTLQSFTAMLYSCVCPDQTIHSVTECYAESHEELVHRTRSHQLIVISVEDK